MKIKLEKLSVRCSHHGRVRVVCPRCAGRKGGMGRKGYRLHSEEVRRMLKALKSRDRQLHTDL